MASIAQAIKNLPPDNDSFLGKLKSTFGNIGNFNLNFVESNSVIGTGGNQVFAQTGQLIGNTITITLNTSMLPGTSNEFKIMTILHEAMHAYMISQRYYPSHSEMAGGTFLVPLVESLMELTGMGGKDALMLSLYGMGDAQGSGNFYNALNSYTNPPLKISDIISIGESNSKINGGSNC